MGIEQRLQPEPQVKGNAYEQDFPDHLALPETLERAAGKLARSQVAQDLFDDPAFPTRSYPGLVAQVPVETE